MERMRAPPPNPRQPAPHAASTQRELTQQSIASPRPPETAAQSTIHMRNAPKMKRAAAATVTLSNIDLSFPEHHPLLAKALAFRSMKAGHKSREVAEFRQCRFPRAKCIKSRIISRETTYLRQKTKIMASLHFRSTGSGKPILALHGYGASLFSWRHLPPVVPDRRVILVDLPGHGG